MIPFLIVSRHATECQSDEACIDGWWVAILLGSRSAEWAYAA